MSPGQATGFIVAATPDQIELCRRQGGRTQAHRQMLGADFGSSLGRGTVRSVSLMSCQKTDIGAACPHVACLPSGFPRLSSQRFLRSSQRQYLYVESYIYPHFQCIAWFLWRISQLFYLGSGACLNSALCGRSQQYRQFLFQANFQIWREVHLRKIQCAHWARR